MRITQINATMISMTLKIKSEDFNQQISRAKRTSSKQSIAELLAVPPSAADIELPLPERSLVNRNTPNTTPQTD